MSEFVNSLYRGFINLPVGVSVTLIVASLTALTRRRCLHLRECVLDLIGVAGVNAPC